MDTGEPISEPAYPGLLQAIGMTLEYYAVMILAAIPFLLTGAGLEMKLEEEPAVSALAALAATAWILARFERRTGAGADVVAGASRFPLGVLGATTLCIAGLLLAETPVILWVLARFPALVPPESPVLSSPSLGGFLYVVLAAPLTEELFYRGMLLRGFVPRYGIARAMVFSSALFALVHVYPVRIPGAMLIGLLLAWLAVRTASIWPGVFAHLLNNGLAYLDMAASPDSTPAAALEWLGNWSFVLLAAGVAVGACGILALRRTFDKMDAAPQEQSVS